MIGFDIAGYAAMSVGGFALGAVFGRKLKSDAAAAIHSIEARVSALEHHSAHQSAALHPAIAHAAAIEKLAGAIEKHAAAVDDHGAATVAAAVESSVRPAAPAAPATVVALQPAAHA
jgi:hypothetical protein